MRPSRFLVTMFVSLAVLVVASSSSAQTVTTLYSFTGTNSSGNPALVTPAQGRNGELYGTTYESVGSVFAISTFGKETQPYTFGTDGTTPAGGLTLGTDGNFYGTTQYGGSSNNGVLFKVSPTGVYTVLHEFQGGSDGSSPLLTANSSFRLELLRHYVRHLRYELCVYCISLRDERYVYDHPQPDF